MNERVRTGGQRQVDACTRTTAELNHRLEVLQAVLLGLTRCKDDIDDVFLDLLIDIYLLYDLTRFLDIFGG